ncbi:MAG: NADH:ubiquinone reductase (Na(+)-transporting) subunit A [Bdellovibrionaceae bacterium]|nr:NADH:ubiquinone reductase (Na(+)-transporting) subunit A [Pseudobdellovibrionaceae bacterium]MAE73775.1 NADH:ubiquinone reductase (Na(+)-transporting) subunit A [Pseudobdellovibrionaceae bacterium]
MRFKIRKGLDLPITGAPSNDVDRSKKVRTVALTGADYIGMKPTMLVKEGDMVKAGQPLFSCKKNEGLIFTAPGAGKVTAINRGPRRVFESMVIQLDDNEQHQAFSSYQQKAVDAYSDDEIRKLLIESGEWTSLRQRPFEKVADVKGKPKSIFVNTLNTEPLAPKADSRLAEKQDAFAAGLVALSKLTDGKVYVSASPESAMKLPDLPQIEKVEFSGPHPAGNVGTHIHMVDPVSPNSYVWHAGYQDVIAIGSLLQTGQLDFERVITLAGPHVKKPRYIITRKGACLEDLVRDELTEGPTRVVSGSVLNGRKNEGSFGYLGHYHQQISALAEESPREFLGWQSPGLDKFSVQRIYLSKLMPSKKFPFNTSRNGSYRAMVPIGSFEKVMPLDILPTQLLRSLVTKDTEQAQDLGCLELAEEDLSLLTFVAPGKVDFGPILRENLSLIEKEG